MPKRIYVGNWPSGESDADVKQAFSQFGRVLSVSLNRDARGRFTGSATVEMSDGADEAIANLNGRVRGGETLTVRE